MVLINSHKTNHHRRGDRIAVWLGRLFCCISTLVLIAWWISGPPLSSSPLRGTTLTNHQQLLVDTTPRLLSLPNTTHISTDVRGNLGPASVMLTDGTDWIKDRWQAASDMHGTAIHGPHWVLLNFSTNPQQQQQQAVRITCVVLDWEAAYSKDYVLEGRLLQDDNNNNNNNMEWFTLYDTAQAPTTTDIAMSSQEQGQSPGVKSKTSLHVVHTLTWNTSPSQPLQQLRLTIRKSAMGWGVSLWKVQVMGFPSPTAAIESTRRR